MPLKTTIINKIGVRISKKTKKKNQIIYLRYGLAATSATINPLEGGDGLLAAEQILRIHILLSPGPVCAVEIIMKFFEKKKKRTENDRAR